MATLGLDIGPTSIGWVLMDENQRRIVAAGARHFPEGVGRDQQGGEQSKSQTRRERRGSRRRTRRRAADAVDLISLLRRQGLLPMSDQELDGLLTQNPYRLRASALDHPLGPHQIGRVLLHLQQRRGFLSNRKTDKPSKAKGIIAEMDELAKAMGKSAARTLGEHLARLDHEFKHASSPPRDRVRRRHTRRRMYIDEFEAIWAEQRKHHPTLLTDELKRSLYHPVNDDPKWVCRGLIFGQRRVYWPRSVIGRCELHPKQQRCSKAVRVAQRFRILQEVNNLRILDRATGDERRLDTAERAKVIDKLATVKELKFDSMRKLLGFSELVAFNFERAQRTKLKGHLTDAVLAGKKHIGTHWRKLSDEMKDAVVDVLIWEDREEVAIANLIKIGLSLEQAQRAIDAHLPDGYTAFCREAIDRLLPHLERGLFLMANDKSDSAMHAAGYLRPDQRSVRELPFLPQAPDLPNPIVRRALVEVRKVVNGVVREYGKPGVIRVELAREAKKSFHERKRIRFDNADRRKRREIATEEIGKLGVKPTRASVNRYILWEEQQHDCPYTTAAKIALNQLFTDAVDVDHILPRWRSLDNSLANQVVCFRDANREKGQRTPREWLEDEDPDRWEIVKKIAWKLPPNKRRKFFQKDIQLDEFVERQLRDTTYIACKAVEFLQYLGVPVSCVSGRMTSDLRHFWGLNTILDPDGRNVKNRADHRHHTIDAAVIALTDAKRLHALANQRGQNITPPWTTFRDDLARTIDSIHVSHRVQRRLAGAFHEEYFYGATHKPHRVPSSQVAPRFHAKDWIEFPDSYVRRKEVSEIKNAKHLAKVRDRATRELLEAHLCRQGVDPRAKAAYPKDAFKGDNAPRMVSGVPIRRVRMIHKGETFRPVSERRDYQFVKPGNNHHIVYRATGEGAKESWNAEVVTMWDAARDARSGRPLVDRTSDTEKGRFVMSLALGEMFEIDHPVDSDAPRLLCVVRKLDQRKKRLDYKLHTDARIASDINKDNLYLSAQRMRTLHATKVTVDPLGRIRRASD